MNVLAESTGGSSASSSTHLAVLRYRTPCTLPSRQLLRKDATLGGKRRWRSLGCSRPHGCQASVEAVPGWSLFDRPSCVSRDLWWFSRYYYYYYSDTYSLYESYELGEDEASRERRWANTEVAWQQLVVMSKPTSGEKWIRTSGVKAKYIEHRTVLLCLHFVVMKAQRKPVCEAGGAVRPKSSINARGVDLPAVGKRCRKVMETSER